MATQPNVHSVQFYDTHDALIDRLSGIVCSGLLIGNSVLIVATQQHRDQLLRALGRLEVDVRKFARDYRFSMRDAQETLSLFMTDGMPDPRLFRATIGQLLTDSKRMAQSKDRGLTVFGEMVSLLWEQGNKLGALALERLWNESLNESAFHLHCAYPRWLFGQDESGMRNICESHSHILNAMGPAA